MDKRLKLTALMCLAAAGLAGCGLLSTRAPVVPGSKKATVIALATSEWIYFGRQTVLYGEEGESIPHVGFWEDDDARSGRVNIYWRAVRQPKLTGKDCDQPWSAAFISWIMSTAGVPPDQFKPADAHWIYLTDIIQKSAVGGRSFLARTLDSYRPEPGDLVCATRGDTRIPDVTRLPSPETLTHTKLHCNVVVDVKGRDLVTIGGNVRNSVSKVVLKLDRHGYLVPNPRHPWFLIVQNQL